MYSIMFDQRLIDIVATKDKKKPKKALNKIFKGATHKMPSGAIHTGKTHTKKSKVVKAAPSPKRRRGRRSGY